MTLAANSVRGNTRADRRAVKGGARFFVNGQLISDIITFLIVAFRYVFDRQGRQWATFYASRGTNASSSSGSPINEIRDILKAK